MRLKDDSVNPDIVRELTRALFTADKIYRDHGQDLVITSLRDGYHSHTSLHYAGAAADLRIWGLADPDAIRAEIKAALGRDYDVILERDHIHLEWQPRRPQ